MWSAIVHIIIGLWLMAMPGVLGAGGSFADSNHIAGPLVVTIGIIALWDINKYSIKVNIIAAAWIIVAPLFIGHDTSEAILNIVAGIILIGSALVKRKDKYNYGGGWASLFKKHPPHMHSGDHVNNSANQHKG